MIFDIEDVLWFCAAVVGFTGVLELGFRFGRYYANRETQTERAHLAALQSGLLGLLSLLLGFNFALAGSRFDTRKQLLQEEASAIKITYLRTQLMPAPLRDQFAKLLNSYVASRLDHMRAGTDQTKILIAENESLRLESQLWELAVAANGEAHGSTVSSLFIPSFNEMVRIKEMRRESLQNHVPKLVIMLLLIVAAGSLGFIAFSCGLVGKRRNISTLVYTLIIASVLTTILDLDQPGKGFIRVSNEPFLDLQKLLNGNSIN